MTENMIRQAQNIWSMLDEMAANDPENYKKFIEKNIKEKNELITQPKEHMCIETVILCECKDKKEENLFVNVMEWSIIPNSHSDKDPISICGGILYEENLNGNNVKITSVAFNPKILEKYGNNCKNIEEKNMLIYLAFEFLENLNNFKLKKIYKLNQENLKGKLPTAASNIHLSLRNKNKLDHDKTLADDLLSSVKSDQIGMYDEGLQDISLPIKFISTTDKLKPEKPLIEILSTEISDENENLEFSDKIDVDFLEYSTPNYSMVKVSNEELKINIELPGVLCVGECQLDVGPNDLVVIVSNKYYLNIKFDREVSTQDVEASFSRKFSCLTICIKNINSN